MEAAALLEAGREVIVREGVYLDERRWDEWLALYAPDCEYWVPTWRSEEALTGDPQAEISHIYYASRAGLEDRIMRIRSGRSPASTPLRRTTHMSANVLLLGHEGDARLRLRSNWTTHVFDPHHKKTEVFFGHALHELRREAGVWLIARRKTVLQNDYLPSMVDIYCL